MEILYLFKIRVHLIIIFGCIIRLVLCGTLQQFAYRQNLTDYVSHGDAVYIGYNG